MMARLNGTSLNKKTFYLITLILVSAVFSSFNRKNLFVPTGMVKIKELGLFVDKTEILNKHWAEYLRFTEIKFGKNTDEYKSILPDMQIWNNLYRGNIENYNSEYANMPVIGISKDQAKAYCKWRSERVFEKYKTKIEYRLPTSDEWCSVFQKQRKKILKLQNNLLEMTIENSVTIIKKSNNSNHKNDNSDSCKVNQNISPSKEIGFRCFASIK